MVSELVAESDAAAGDEVTPNGMELLFAAHPAPMFIYEPATLRLLAVNRAAISQYGYSREEFLSLSLRELRPAEDIARLERIVRGLRGPSASASRHRRKDGSLIIVSIYSSPIRFENHDARLVVAADVTEQQLATEKIRQSQANLALAQRVAHMGSWEVDLTNREDRENHPPRWSDETFRIFGFRPGEIQVTHESFFHLLHPDERELARETFIQQLRTGAPYSIDHRIIHPDGSERIVHVQSDTVRDSEGRLVKMAGTVQDLTERRRAERLLGEQAELINLAPDAILVRGLDGTVRMWNQGAERLYGWTAPEIIGKHVADFIYQDRADYGAANEALLREGEWRGELKQVRKDGGKIIVCSRSTLVRDERGEPDSVLIIHTDVTEQKKLEAQFLRSQRLESIGTLAAGVAHDLNNILAPILLVAPLLRTDLPADEKETFLSLVQASAERGANLVKQMLTFARGADGERVLLQPSYLVEEVAKIAGETFPKSITIRTNYPQDLWMIEGDPTQLQQVLLNLCVNARDAMPNGGGLRISAENFRLDEHYASMTAGAQAGPHVLLQISDNGTGIPRHVIDKIFDPFFTTKEIGAGTGLGLSTVIGIVKSYGGFVNVYSEPGRTSFKVFLPASNAISPPSESAESLPLPNGHGEKILIVDDEPSIRTAAQTLLTGCGYEPFLAEDGVTALAIYAQRPTQFDLVLTDLVMPLMDGITLIRALRKLNPRQKIIVSTGRDEEVQSPQMKSLNIEACLFKPHSREKLLRTVDEALRATCSMAASDARSRAEVARR